MTIYMDPQISYSKQYYNLHRKKILAYQKEYYRKKKEQKFRESTVKFTYGKFILFG